VFVLLDATATVAIAVKQVANAAKAASAAVVMFAENASARTALAALSLKESRGAQALNNWCSIHF